MSKVKCPRTKCKREAQIHKIYGILPCKQCQADDTDFRLIRSPEFVNISKANRIQQSRDIGEKDMLQPWGDSKGNPNQDFVKAYPEHRETYFTQDQLNKI